MTDVNKKWIEIGIKLQKDLELKLKCPVCGIGEIRVMDIALNKSNLIDRYLICDNCNNWQVATGEFSPASGMV